MVEKNPELSSLEIKSHDYYGIIKHREECGRECSRYALIQKSLPFGAAGEHEALVRKSFPDKDFDKKMSDLGLRDITKFKSDFEVWISLKNIFGGDSDADYIIPYIEDENGEMILQTDKAYIRKCTLFGKKKIIYPGRE